MAKQASTEIWEVVHEERRSLIRDLESLKPIQWTTESLCPGWDIYDVVAHLVDTAKTTRLGFVRRMLATGFDFDRDNAAGVSREKNLSPADTLSNFRAVAERTSTPPVNLATRLVEMFLHGEDIRQPLSIHRDYPPDQVAHALDYQVKTSVKIGGGKELAEGWRLVATDTAYEHGAGPEVHAPAILLLLAVSGRPIAASELTGVGAGAFVESTRGEAA